jgi:CHAT domain-containing protein
MRKFLLIAALLLLPGLAAAQAPGPQLGQTLAGEACRAGGSLSDARPVEIFCGDSAESVGRLEVRADGSVDAALAVRAQAAAAARAADAQMSCGEGQAIGASVLFLCTQQSNSWPRILLVTGSALGLVVAEGMPALLPVLAAASATLSGGSPVDIAAAQRLLADRIPASLLGAASTDMARHAQAVERARIYSSGNDFAAAEAALRGALEIDTRLFGPNATPVGLALMELALQVSNQGRFDEAGSLFRRAQPIIEASPSADARARLNSYLALDAANQRDFARALAYARQATAERRAQLDAANGMGGIGGGFSGLPAASSGELAHSLRIEAEMALRLGNLADAQAAAEQALWIINLEPGLALWWRADVLSLMAEVNERQGHYAAAERNLLDAIDLRRKLFGDTAPVVQSRLAAGRFYAEQQSWPEALAQFRAAMAILEKDAVARSRVVPDQLVPFIATAAAMDAGPQRAQLDADIFRAIQLVDSDLAGQAIARASARLAAADPALAGLVRDADDARRQRDQLRIDIAAELARSDDERDTARQARLQQQLAQAVARTDDLMARVARDFPGHARLANPGPADLADVRAQLRPGEAFLSYVIGFRGGYGLLVTRDGLTVEKLDVTSDALAADIALLRRAFTPQLGSLPDFPLRTAHALYNQLLAPFADDLKTVNRLVVAPGPVLADLPFSLLVTAPSPEGTNYIDAAWLIRGMAVSQVPGPRAFLALRQAERARVAAPRPFLGLGDPLLTGADSGGRAALETLALNCREAAPMQPALLRALSPLHDTAGEVNGVARALGGDADSVLLGAGASESALRARPLDQYRVLYFATHGLLPGELHCQAEPGLVLSPPASAAATTDADGLLEAGEVASLRLNADLVVLSACNTAAAGGGRFGGGSLEGLADSFFNAGARAVLASHWEVPSAATAALMEDVFRRYGADRARGLAEALRQAQLDLARVPATAHPFYWAAFTLIGAGDATGGDTARIGQHTNGGT